MKTIQYLIICFFLLGFIACEDKLNTDPTSETSKEKVFETADNAFAAINGIYRSFYTTGWSEGYPTENFGQASVNLAADIMSEDMVEYAPGSQWFWYDYLYWVRTSYNNTSDRPYVWWNMYYTWISNANYIIAFAPGASGDPREINNIVGQAYALRAYCYLYLAQFYQRTYIGHENDPGVPIYTEPTTNETEGAPRGTLKETYDQINKDLDEAIKLLSDATPQKHKSHIDLYVAYGIKARVSLIQENWSEAATAAESALEKPNLALMSTTDLLSGMNNIGNVEWMWASEIVSDQAGTWYSFFGHMDASAGYHAATAQKCVNRWLYDMISPDDIRKKWFNGIMTVDPSEALPEDVDYCQKKFRDPSTSLDGDLVYMRAAEMYLIMAEAKCQLGDYAGARTALKSLIDYKYPGYEAELAKRTDSKELTLKSTESKNVQTLMDEIILQRRIELWGEGFRVLDIMRLKTGFARVYPGTNHTDVTAQFDITDPESWEWIMMIPQKEFDGNPNMDPAKDQNPE